MSICDGLAVIVIAFFRIDKGLRLRGFAFMLVSLRYEESQRN